MRAGNQLRPEVAAPAQDDLAAIAASVDRFCSTVVDRLVERPERVLSPAGLAQITAAAREVGILPAPAPGLGLWEDAREPAALARSLATLERAGESCAGVAFHLHRLALAAFVARELGEVAAGNAAVHLGDGEPLLVHAAEPWDELWVPLVDAGEPGWVRLQRQALEVAPIAAQHGLDEVALWDVRVPAAAAERALLRGEPARLVLLSALGVSALGLAAISLGAARHALRLARAHAASRRQGGALIEEHPAVQQLLGEAAAAIATVASALRGVRALPSAAPQLTQLLGLRATAHRLLCESSNASLQVLGGMGYMRDAGAEKIVRDQNHLRLVEASPCPLWRAPGEKAQAQPADEAARALHPSAAFAQLPRAIRALVAYEPAPLWEMDTRLLPVPLQRYRRKVREFAARVLAPRALAADLSPHGPEEREVLVAAAREGFLTDLLPWPLGSIPWGRARYPLALAHCIKMEELCAACGGLGLLIGAHGLGSIPLLLSGDVGAIRRFLLPAYRRTSAGDPRIFAFAITEPGAGSDVEESAGAALLRPGTRARRVEGGFRLSGRKIFISGGDIAEHVTVFAALEDEGMASWTCFVVSRGMPGFSVVRRELKMGQRAAAAAELLFEDVFVPDSHVAGGLRRGWAINRATLNLSRVPVAAIALGIARGAVEAALDLARRSQRGGRPLLEHQDVQLEIARLWAELAAMRALVWQSSSRWTSRQARASMAKVFCSDTAVRVCERAMALIGERALVHQNRAEKAFRDARLTQIYEGTNQINLLAVVEDQLDELLGRDPQKAGQ